MQKFKESFLPLDKPPGHAQVDFRKFKYYDAFDRSCDGHALIVSFPNSNTGWMQVFPSENQECLLEGLKRIFYHIGGVPIRVRCDNMTTAVVQILEGTERVITDGFYRFMLHHRFKADFCNPGKGNEKGNVENTVDCIQIRDLGNLQGRAVGEIEDFDGSAKLDILAGICLFLCR